MTRLHGIKKVCGQTKSLPEYGYYGPVCLELLANTRTGEVWANEQADTNSRTMYYDKDIQFCGILRHPMTMADIKETIAEALKYYRHIA